MPTFHPSRYSRGFLSRADLMITIVNLTLIILRVALPTTSILSGIEDPSPPCSLCESRTLAVVLVLFFAPEDEVLGSFVKHSVVRLALLQGIISDVALSLHLLHLLLAQLLDVEDLFIAEPEDGLLNPGTVDAVRSVALPGVTPADVRAVGSCEVSDAIAEGVLVSGCGVLWGDETVFSFEALLPEGEDGVFEVREYPDFFDDIVCVGVVLDVNDHGVDAPGLELWLGRLAMVVYRWWS